MFPYITIFGRILPTYGLFLAAGLIVTYTCARVRTIRAGRAEDDLMIIGAVALGCALLGAKVLYIAVTFTPYQLLQLIEEGKFSEILNIGFVFYGGLFGGIAGAFLGAKIAGVSLWSFEQDVFPVLPLGYALGRIGCWFSGCCYGNIRFPVQILDASVSVGVSLFLIHYTWKKREPCVVARVYLITYAVQRFLIEFFRADSIRRHLGPLSTSQWISVLLLLTCGIWICVAKCRNVQR